VRQATQTGRHERLRRGATTTRFRAPLRSRGGAPLIVALSGGVDSAVAALLLRDQGHNVEGLFMSNWDDDDAYCTSAQDYQDARAVARELDIPLHRVSFAAQYRERVFSYFLDEHRHGRTPNPDVLCNREIKFGAALDYARRLGSERLATGHYARVQHGPCGAELLKGLDAAKDQSYFLHALERVQLDRALLPLGELRKEQVRERARSAGLPVYDKPDSTGICFIGERPFRDFLSHYLSDTPGPILTPEGESLGEHRGLAFYTLGQRAGLGLGGRRGHAERPWYVAGKDPSRNALIVVQEHDHPLLTSTRLRTGPMHWIGAARSAPFQCGVKVRYRQADQAGCATPQPDGGLIIDFEQPQRAITPGQFAVLYEADRCVGGAMIEETLGAL
jgi:tRNA-specific 2-thiouridylase